MGTWHHQRRSPVFSNLREAEEKQAQVGRSKHDRVTKPDDPASRWMRVGAIHGPPASISGAAHTPSEADPPCS